MQKNKIVILITLHFILYATASPDKSIAQVYVDQANQSSSSAYVEQTPLGATPQRVQVPKPSSQHATTAKAPQQINVTNPFPTVHSGTTAIVKLEAGDWPSVGKGAIKQNE